MPKKEKANKSTEEAQNTDKSPLVAAAEAVGKAAGKVAAVIGVTPDHPPHEKKGKLQPKNKRRLPRKLKKAQKKQAAASGQKATPAM